MNGFTKKDTDTMTSLEKGLYLLSLFAEAPYILTVADIVKMTGLNRTTVYRNLSSLEEQGLLIKDGKDKSYKIGPMTYHLGNAYLINSSFKDDLLTVLEKIGKESSESVGMAHREGDKVVSIFSIETHQPVKINDRPGVFYPMNKGCFGKGLMAYYDEKRVKEMLHGLTFKKTAENTLTKTEDILKEYENIRKQGYIESIEETVPYVMGTGIPLKSRNGKVENVVAISFFKQKDYMKKLEKLRDILFKYKRELELYLP